VHGFDITTGHKAMPASVFTVKAMENSVSGGTGLNTGIQVQPGQLIVISVDPRDTWSAGAADRTSNANGLGNPFGGNYGLYTRGSQSFLYGALVGSIDNGSTYFGIGTHLSMTALTNGTLKLYYWDSNNNDNAGSIRVVVATYTGPTNTH
jgi:hypothetical protein